MGRALAGSSRRVMRRHIATRKGVRAVINEIKVNSSRVETTQIAPTVLRLLGLNPNALQAVQIEHTSALPLGD